MNNVDYLSAYVGVFNHSEDDRSEVDDVRSVSEAEKQPSSTKTKRKKKTKPKQKEKSTKASQNSGSSASNNQSGQKARDAKAAAAEEEDPTQYQMTDKEKQELRQTKTFRKIEAELKERNRRHKRNLENDAKSKKRGEVDGAFYVDKSRQAAVGQAEDLKGHILKHRGDMMRSKTTGESEILGLFILLEQAEYELKHGDPEKALAYIQRGIKIRPEHTELLVLRSRCMVELNKFKAALEDVDFILSTNKNLTLTSSINQQNSTALTVKGDALYNLGNFEHALLNYQRALRFATTKVRNAQNFTNSTLLVSVWGEAGCKILCSFQERDGLNQRVARTELAICNAVGPTASQYFKKLDIFLRRMPPNIMGLSWFKLKNVADASTNSEGQKQSRASVA